MSCLSDSDDSDDEFLQHQRVFAKPEPKTLPPIQMFKDILAGNPIADTQQSVAKKRKQKRKRQTTKQPKKPKLSKSERLRLERREERRKDPQWIEEQARKTVDEELGLDVVDRVADLNDIGWVCESTKRSKKIEYYPAVISRNKAEANILLKNSGKKKYKTIKIQYIGVDWGDNSKHQEIALSKWIPYPNSSESENEERLQKFVKTISKKDKFRNNPLDLKIEEFAIRKMWEKVKMQMEQRKLEEEKDLADALQSSCNSGASRPSATALTVTQDSDNNSQQNKEEQDTGNTDSSDDESLGSPEKKKKKQETLRVNDEIEYYDLMATFGDASSLRKAKIVGIKPNEKFPLVLTNTIMPIPGTHTIRRLPDGAWQAINNFILFQGGVQSLTGSGSGFDTSTKQIRKVQSELHKVRDEFWENEYRKSEQKKEKQVEDRDEATGSGGMINDDDAPVRRSRRSSLRSRRKTF